MCLWNTMPTSRYPGLRIRKPFYCVWVTVTLTFDLVTWKSIGVICESWSMYLWSFMILGVSVLELSSGNHFTISGHRDLDLWPSDLEINRGHLRVMINLPMKFHDPRRMRSWVIIRKPFYYFGSPWPWPLTDLELWPSDLKINSGHLRVMINVPMKFHKRSWIIIRKPLYYFRSLWPWPLTQWPQIFLPSDLKIYRGHLPVMINLPMKFHDPRPKRSWVIIKCEWNELFWPMYLTCATLKDDLDHSPLKTCRSMR